MLFIQALNPVQHWILMEMVTISGFLTMIPSIQAISHSRPGFAPILISEVDRV